MRGEVFVIVYNRGNSGQPLARPSRHVTAARGDYAQLNITVVTQARRADAMFGGSVL